jgi:hypothetical protein
VDSSNNQPIYFEDLEPYTSEPSKNFLQFVARYLSLYKSDPSNNPTFKSCLLRVPYTFNSKCLDESVDAEVKIIQQWVAHNDCLKSIIY